MTTRTATLFLRYFIPVTCAGHAANNGWYFYLSGSEEVRLLFPFVAVMALATVVVRRFSIDHSRYCLAFAVGVEAAARAVKLVQNPPPPSYPAGLHMALTLLLPILTLLADAWMLASIPRLQNDAQPAAAET